MVWIECDERPDALPARSLSDVADRLLQRFAAGWQGPIRSNVQARRSRWCLRCPYLPHSSYPPLRLSLSLRRQRGSAEQRQIASESSFACASCVAEGYASKYRLPSDSSCVLGWDPPRQAVRDIWRALRPGNPELLRDRAKAGHRRVGSRDRRQSRPGSLRLCVDSRRWCQLELRIRSRIVERLMWVCVRTRRYQRDAKRCRWHLLGGERCSEHEKRS